MAWRAHFWTATLSDTHLTRSLLEPQYHKRALEHPVALNRLSVREHPKLRGAITDTHSEILTLTKTFASCALEAWPGQCLLDLFLARTVFHLRSEYLEPEPGTPPDTTDVAAYHVWLYENVVKGTIKAHLDGIRDEAHAEPNTVYSTTDASIPAKKKYQALTGFALFQGDEQVDSACYISGKVLAPEAELSTIRFAVVWATKVPGCTRIIIFMDHIASAKKALDPSVHSGQGHSLAVCCALLVWFAADPLNALKFYDCPSKAEWDVHHEVHQFLLGLPPVPGLRPRMTLDSLRKYATDRCNAEWCQLFFRDPTFSGRQFLQLLDLDDNLIKPSLPQRGELDPCGQGEYLTRLAHDLSNPWACTNHNRCDEDVSTATGWWLPEKELGCTHIVIFTDHITSAKKALDPLIHSGQGHSLAVCHALLVWFDADPLNTLEFYDCPSKAEWDVHRKVHQFLKDLPPVPEWRQLFFRDPTFASRQFLQLLNLDDNLIKPSYLKGGS
ncbi:hypothetical protein HYPSUDRAFT_209437 [Hypholoma sublateritium FD-334 SS-4]|uniref:Uncharacterized protein n=1 Tax=Hypholoma sublateritium (strain FD-334 SS-4) TaxID=945553 RepID=A0A0D2KGB3_HYPSF|nr:hypothetical protein HYPSUDRAFT_209437 [Hypholoma sublateritium FD-334 SS-4]